MSDFTIALIPRPGETEAEYRARTARFAKANDLVPETDPFAKDYERVGSKQDSDWGE